ncbi:hypothetical protein OSCT_0309 [Oscillochloris trichoides DG-6]|uniref:Uncharacterized protein n=1 Tax=Oscillochloris trichoides DG-6 TaxID=765420 RepID=E1IAF8_9CHLR|nr:hypothetical protein OSCT_0309 [Oscillochloris trichoides DG-6]
MSVSIRRADLGLSELGSFVSFSFCGQGFNPPGGFGAFGTGSRLAEMSAEELFQSAGRIWGFRNIVLADKFDQVARVSIRRADLGLSEPWVLPMIPPLLACFNPPGGFGAFGTEPDRGGDFPYSGECKVSIRRADLGLSEQADRLWDSGLQVGFNPPGGFGAFGTPESGCRPLLGVTFQSAGRIWGFRNYDNRMVWLATPKFQSAGRIWGFRNNCPRIGYGASSPVSIRRADLGLSEHRSAANNTE